MIKRQEGMTAISMMVLIGGLVFVASLVLKVAPVYVDNSSVNSVVTSFDGKNDMAGSTKKMVLEAFHKRLRINNVTTLPKEAVSLVKKDGDFILVVEYEPRGQLIGSLEYIVSFRHEAKFPAN